MASSIQNKIRTLPAKRTSSGRVVKQNKKYGKIQGREFNKVLDQLIGGPASDEEEEFHEEEEHYTDTENYEEEEEEEMVDLDDTLVELQVDDVSHCLICWVDRSPSAAAASACNQLRRYAHNAGNSRDTDLVVGVLTMPLDGDTKMDFLCTSCAHLIRLLEEREAEVVAIRQQILSKFNASGRQKPDRGIGEKNSDIEVSPEHLSTEGPPEPSDMTPCGDVKSERDLMHDQEVLQESEIVSQDQEEALQALLADGEEGMFGIAGLRDRARFDALSAPPPPPPPVSPPVAARAVPVSMPATVVSSSALETRLAPSAVAAESTAASTTLDVATTSVESPQAFAMPSLSPEHLLQGDDAVDAYLDGHGSWSTVPAEPSSEATSLIKTAGDLTQTKVAGYLCCTCSRVFPSEEGLARHEYFKHGIGDLCGAGAQLGLSVSVENRGVGIDSGELMRKAEVAARLLNEGGSGVDDDNEHGEGKDRHSILNAGKMARSTHTMKTYSKRRGKYFMQTTQHGGDCQYCGLHLRTDLQGHINRFHTMVRPFKCSICNERFPSHASLTHHKRTFHGSGYPCSYCGATFIRPKQLSMHQWKKHNIGGVQCRECGKKFARSDTLDNHMRCHERPLQCSLCSCRYPFKRELRNHEFLKHGLHGEIPRDTELVPGEVYRCEKCGRCFACQMARDRHDCSPLAALSDLYVCQLCGDWSTRFEGDMVKHMRNLHKIEAGTILIADVEEGQASDINVKNE